MRIRELMVKPVVAVSPDMSLHELAIVLSEHEIFGVPVVGGEGDVLGVVSESDIVEKERGPDEESCGLLARLLRRRRSAAAYATTAGEAMTSPAIVVEPWMSVYEAAWLMSVNDVNRLPVVEADKLVGVIARADLVRYFARSDDDIAREVRDELDLMSLADIDVVVEEGRVVLQGDIESEKDLRCLPHAISRVPGVVSVEPRVTLRPAAEHAASRAR